MKKIINNNHPPAIFIIANTNTLKIVPHRNKQLGRTSRQEWRKKEKLHREEDKPSIIYPNGAKYWCKKGLLHREGDKPSIIYPNGEKHWYKKGTLQKRKGCQLFVCSAKENW